MAYLRDYAPGSTVVKYAAIAASSGDTTLVAAVAGKRIRVISYTLVVSAAANARFESGTGGTALTGQMALPANGGIAASENPSGHFQTAAGALLNLELSTGSAAGHLSYIEV